MLTDVTRRQLQRLRFLLEEALARTQDPTEIGRHSALVLLDGACEYALGIGLGHRGQPSPRNFPDKFKKLQEEVVGWKPDTWSSVLQLHEARNQAQHHGTVADVSNMPSWAAQAQRFIDSLVVAVFSVELRSVLLAEAVETQDVRLPLIEAEKALEQQDAAGAFARAATGFEIARSAWRGQRTEAIGQLLLTYSGLSGISGVETDPTNLSLLRFEDLSEVQPFAPDIGEYHWLLARRGETSQQIVPTLETARRAFLFVVAWVLRWEAFAARYEARSYPPSEPPYEPPVTGSDHPVIHNIDVVAQQQTGMWLDSPTFENARYLVKVTLADVPAQERDLWARQVGDVLNDAVAQRGFEHVGAAHVDGGGIVRFHGVRSDVTGDEIRSWIDFALVEGDRRYRQKLAEQLKQDASLPKLRKRLKEAVNAATTDDIVADVVSEGRDDGSVWVGVQLRRDADPMLGHVLDRVAHSARSNATGIDYYNTTLWFTPDHDFKGAAAIIERVAADYNEQAATRQRGITEIEKRRQALDAELRK